MPDPPPSPHPLSYAQPPARHSPAGVISFVCGIIAVLSLCLSLVGVKSAPGSGAISRFLAIAIFAAFVAILLLGLTTGIIGVLPPRRKRGLAIAGLVLNGLVSVLILLLVITVWLRHH